MATLIKNKDQYMKYLDEIEGLMDIDPIPNSPEGERLSLLALAVKDYESKRFFFKKPTAVEAIKFCMEEQKLKQVDLIPYIGSKSKVSEILSGKRKLTVPMIRALNRYLDIPAELLIHEGESDETAITAEDFQVNNFPIREICKAGWIKATTAEIQKVPEIVIQRFLEPVGGLSLQSAFFKRSYHKRTATQDISGALFAWTVKLLIESKKQKVARYSKDKVTSEFLKEVAKLSFFEKGPLLAVEYLANFGIRTVILPALKITKIDGGSLLDEMGIPIIGLTLRHDRLDNFWFTLLHELAHVYKHLSGTKKIFVDDTESIDSINVVEKEADRIARDAFIPRNMWKRSEAFSLQTEDAVKDFAKSLNIHPAIVAGRIRFEANKYTHLTNLLGNGTLRQMFGIGE